MQAAYDHAFRGEAGIVVLGDLYAFGAATSYSFVFIALIALRLNDPLSPRKFRIPLNIPFNYRGERVYFPIVGVIGFLGIFSILIDTLITHEIGRVAGPTWIVCGFIGYLIYRKYKKLPIFGSQKRDWDAQQVTILKDAGELEAMDELLEKLRARGRGVPAPVRTS
jgi:APA family basic amino acid/polyamine antiporter